MSRIRYTNKSFKSNSDIFTDALYSEFNRSLETSVFPPSVKLENVTPVHKKGTRSEKNNYRSGSILPNLSKVFERCIYYQITQFFDKILSKHQCCFRKGHSAQHSLIVLFEKWKYSVDQGHLFRALQTYLSKAFYCLPHNLLIAKLLKGNASKCHLLISCGENVHVNIGTSQIKNSDCERLLGIDLDCKLSSENHINQICSEARAKIARARIVPFLNKKKSY